MKPNRKRVEVYDLEGKLLGTYTSLTEAAKAFKTTLARVSHIGNKKNPIGKINGIKYKVVVPRAASIIATYDENVLFRPGETEDDVRRRLGLNPYGEWRNDEWIYAMMDRVNKELYPDGFDERLQWNQRKLSERKKKEKERQKEEDIDESNYDLDD